MTSHISTFVVRTPTDWSVCYGDRRLPVSFGVDEVVATFTGDGSGGPAPDVLPHSPYSWVEPQPAIVAHATDGGLLVEGPSGTTVLDAVDVHLLDAITTATQVSDVVAAVQARLGADEPGEEALLRRVRRLTDLARLRLTYEDPNPYVPPSPAVAEEEAPEPVVTAAPSVPPAPRPLWKRVAKRAKREVSSRTFPGKQALRSAYRTVRPVPTPAVAPGAGEHGDETASETALSTDTSPTDTSPTDTTPTDTTPTDTTPTEDLGAEAAIEEAHPAPPADDELEPIVGIANDVPEEVAAAAAEAREAAGLDGGGTPRVDPRILYLDDPRVGPPVADRVPVYAVFQADIGPPLSLGMLTAATRAHDDGALNEHFEIRRSEDVASFLDDLATRSGPAIMLCSNYVWSAEANLEAARQAKAINPDLLVIHGGPSTPKYELDAEAYFATHPDIVDVTVRAEGEHTLCDVLGALAAELPAWDLGALAGVQGISYRDPATGAMVRTEDRDRNATLDELPSPYLTGEFDHLHPSVWDHAYAIFETNRGCPYGCTFCDWGSSTLSRIRKFTLDRVFAEMEWAAERKLPSWVVADANLGIMSRDVEVVEKMAELRGGHGAPTILGFNVAKNTTKHLTAIVNRLVDAGIAPHVSLALQTRDEETLDAVRRQNISTDHYVAMAASFRRHGLPLQADLMLGLPGQTPDSLRGDLQFLIEHEVPLRVWITQLLPNSPMNDPEYREEWAIRADENGVVMATASFTEEDREAMLRLRYAHAVFERFGLLRHIMRYAWWDHGIPATDIIQRAIDRSVETPDRYPLLNWTLRFFDFFPVPPLGWASFYEEVRRFLAEEFGLLPSSSFDTVMALQEFLMPEYDRELPATLELDHDYVAYYQDATRQLWIDGHATGAERPLADYGPKSFTIYGDPMYRNSVQMRVSRDPRNQTMTDEFWMSGHFELDSPLVMNYAEVAAHGGFVGLLEQVPDGVDLTVEDTPVPRRNAIPVSIGTRQGSPDGVDTIDDD